MTRRLWWLALLWCQFLTTGAQAGTIRLAPGQDSYNLNASADVLEDASRRLRIENVVAGGAANAFKPPQQGLSSFGFTDSAFWLRFRIDNPEPAARRMLLVLRTNWLDTVQVFSPDAWGLYTEQRLGDTLPFRERPYAMPQLVVDLQVAPGISTYYLRLTSTQAFMTPIELWEPESFHQNDRLWSAYYGMVYGILLVMVLYNGFIWAAMRDRNYFFYCVYLIAFFMMNFSYSGFAYQYLWPESPRWSNWSHTHWIFLFLAMAIVFSMHFLESRTRLPRMHRLLQAYLGVMLVSWIGVTAAGDTVAYNAAPVYFVFGCTPLILAAGVAAWFNGYRAARFFVLASMATLVGSFFTALTASGFLPYTFANFHAAEFGIMADVVLLSLALADRIRTLREQREAAELREIEQRLHTAAVLEQSNEELERTVLERTAELARARDEAERFARIDALTSVANRRYFEEVAVQEFARARRYDQPLSVMVMDIDLFKQINDTHGHAAGDIVIQTVAAVARESVRDADFVARIGGEEFCILLPDIHLEQAMVTAERLRERIARCTLEHGGHPLVCTASFGVSELAGTDLSFGALLQRADQAMYAAKQAGRNRVMAGSPAGAAPQAPHGAGEG
ncbi:sensor domain-containing diguanylate cyclase [Paenacidovorax monticola]|uniref:diguanylate cyclase n=1 Tax=Paenacidovorax monticola TaxID=1926868 RepID=A0A7H0HJZ7_9BURK|nr:diguanylate cyclase [Paenacidovorax monticola]QNP60863.1 diguanylate cyclase [Paenacidovorax monticola]